MGGKQQNALLKTARNACHELARDFPVRIYHHVKTQEGRDELIIDSRHQHQAVFVKQRDRLQQLYREIQGKLGTGCRVSIEMVGRRHTLSTMGNNTSRAEWSVESTSLTSGASVSSFSLASQYDDETIDSDLSMAPSVASAPQAEVYRPSSESRAASHSQDRREIYDLLDHTELGVQTEKLSTGMDRETSQSDGGATSGLSDEDQSVYVSPRISSDANNVQGVAPKDTGHKRNLDGGGSRSRRESRPGIGHEDSQEGNSDQDEDLCNFTLSAHARQLQENLAYEVARFCPNSKMAGE